MKYAVQIDDEIERYVTTAYGSKHAADIALWAKNYDQGPYRIKVTDEEGSSRVFVARPARDWKLEEQA